VAEYKIIFMLLFNAFESRCARPKGQLTCYFREVMFLVSRGYLLNFYNVIRKLAKALGLK